MTKKDDVTTKQSDKPIAVSTKDLACPEKPRYKVVELAGRTTIVPDTQPDFTTLQTYIGALGNIVTESGLQNSIKQNQEMLENIGKMAQQPMRSLQTAVGAMQSIVDSQMNLACTIGLKMSELPSDYSVLAKMAEQMSATSASLALSVSGLVASESFKSGTTILGSLLLDASTLNKPTKVDKNTTAELSTESIKPTWDDGKTKWDSGAKWGDGKTAEVSIDGRATVKTQHGLLTYEEGALYGMSAEILAGVSDIKEMLALEKLGKQAKEITPEQLKVLARKHDMKVMPMYIKKIVYKAERPPLLYIGDATPIQFTINSMMQEVCQVFFGGSKLPNEPLHVEDIVKAIEGPYVGLDKASIKKYGDKIYQAIRHINTEVSILMGTKEKLIINTSTDYYELNRKLLKLDK